MQQKNRIPLRRVYADTYTLTVDGVEYRPHAGEWVEFSPLGTVGAYIDGLRLKASPPPTEDEEDERLLAIVERIRSEVRRRVVAWDWTDAVSGEPLPQPREGGLEALSLGEMLWLQSAMSGDADPKAGAAASTSPSRGKRAASSRKAG